MAAESALTTLLPTGPMHRLQVNIWVIVAVVVATRTVAVMTATTIIAIRTVIVATVTATPTTAVTTGTTGIMEEIGIGTGTGVTAVAHPLVAGTLRITEGAGATRGALLVAAALHVAGITKHKPPSPQLASLVGEGWALTDLLFFLSSRV